VGAAVSLITIFKWIKVALYKDGEIELKAKIEPVTKICGYVLYKNIEIARIPNNFKPITSS